MRAKPPTPLPHNARYLSQYQALNEELHAPFGISHAMARVRTDLEFEALAGIRDRILVIDFNAKANI